MPGLISELKRRNVFKVAAVYIVGGWLILQVAEVLLGAMEVPGWGMRLILAILIIGFIPALIFSWVYELTPEGIVRESEIDRERSVTDRTGRRLNLVITGLLAATVALLAADRFWPRDAGRPTSAAQPEPTTGTPVVRDQSIAVLPFDNRSAEESDAYFVEGIHDDILTFLAKIKDLKVISRTSVMAYEETTKRIGTIAAELGVAHVVEGAVQRAGERVRVTVQLIDAGTDQHLWAESYDRQLTASNLCAIQSEVASSIAAALEATLSPQEKQRISRQGTDSLEAYQLYLQGRYLFHRRNPDNIDQAVELLEAAVELDPAFAEGWTALASAYVVRPGYSDVSRDDAYAKGIAAARRAIELDPSQGQAHATIAGTHEESGRMSEAEIGFAEALKLEPNNPTIHLWYGELLSNAGRSRDADDRFLRALELDPTSQVATIHRAFELLAQDLGEKAIDVATSISDPSLQGWVAYVRALERLQAGDHETIEDLVAPHRERIPGFWSRELVAALETPDALPAAIERLTDPAYPDPALAAVGMAALGATDRFFVWLDEAYDRQPSFSNILWHPQLADFRRDPRFIDFLERRGFVDYWRAYGWSDWCRPVGETVECQ
ncbi:MAG: hypothetical protein R3200_08815 [Xanthomonadales bacterium]|nr:hypothetical protein [Xanthomonadales bacterium]